MTQVVRNKKMQPVLDFASKNSFDVDFTNGQHLRFTGHGCTVFGPKSPSTHRGPMDVIRKLKLAMRTAAAKKTESE